LDRADVLFDFRMLDLRLKKFEVWLKNVGMVIAGVMKGGKLQAGIANRRETKTGVRCSPNSLAEQSQQS
jgi:hypothetical protein